MSRRSPRAIRICASTRSTPVTISVMGCSTCSRVFISRKKKRPSSSRRNSIVPALVYPPTAQPPWRHPRCGLEGTGIQRGTAFPRSPSDAAAGSSIRARRTAAPFHAGRPATVLRCAEGGRAGARDRSPESPKAVAASERAARIELDSSSGEVTSLIPLPPPPATALMRSGYPMRAAARSITDSASPGPNGSSVPGTTGTPAAIAARRAAVLLPISAIASGVGPMNVSPASRHAAGKASFSARNP